MMSYFRPDRIQAAREGAVLNGMWLMSDSPDLARVSSSVGYDYVCIDMQHGLARAGDLVRMGDAIRAGGDALVAARVPDNRFTEIGMFADAGVEILIVPLVSSADDARRAVSALDYPDAGGQRSWGPTATVMLSAEQIDARARPLLLVMVENAAGLAAVEEIAAVDGVDGIYIGPSDLAFAVGSVPGPEQSATSEAIARILDVTQAAGKIAAIHGSSGEEAARRRAQGFTFLTTSNDVGTARTAYAADLKTSRG